MQDVYIVGSEFSFTWIASENRYGSKYNFINGGNQQNLLRKLNLKNKNRITKSTVIPIWNSNSGTVILDDKTQENLTAGLLKGNNGKITDLWGEQIKFCLGAINRKLFKNGKIYSVKLAKEQCSDFFEINKGMKFKHSTTTTEACEEFIKNKTKNDIVLCSAELLKKFKINIVKLDVSNPFNYTVFFGVNRYPRKYNPKISLGCFIMDLQGKNELPLEFISHWTDITKTKKIIDSKNIISTIPKIIFILRYEDSKALLLIEMQKDDNLNDPWIDVSGDSNIKLIGQVGLLNNSFSHETAELIRNFKVNKRRNVIFYGRQICEGKEIKQNYFWICPALKISVHGFEPEIVKKCAQLQVDRLNDFRKDGKEFPRDAFDVLVAYDKNNKTLKLSSDSVPDLK